MTRNDQTARQAHLYRGIFPVLCKDPAHSSWAEDVDLRVNLGMNVGEWWTVCWDAVAPQNALLGPLVGTGRGTEPAACVVTVSGWEREDSS